jgi:hypothetical protein
MTQPITFTPEQVRVACDRLATPPRGKRPLGALARVAKSLEPYIKEQMPPTKGLARDPLDAVAYANPLGYLPEIRGLANRGADSYGLLAWSARMETIAVYAAARVLDWSGVIRVEDGRAGAGYGHRARDLERVSAGFRRDRSEKCE